MNADNLPDPGFAIRSASQNLPKNEKWTATEAITWLAFERPESLQVVIERELRAFHRRARLVLDRVPALAVLCDADEQWAKSYMRAHGLLLGACRTQAIRCWGDRNENPRALPALLPENVWMRGVAIARDALQASATADGHDYHRVRDKEELLYRNLEFLSGEIIALRTTNGSVSSAATGEEQLGGQQSSIKKEGRRGGQDYRGPDQLLVEEALEGLITGLFSNPMDSARALSSRAIGKGSAESKSKRLVTLIGPAFRSRNQSGQC